MKPCSGREVGVPGRAPGEAGSIKSNRLPLFLFRYANSYSMSFRPPQNIYSPPEEGFRAAGSNAICSAGIHLFGNSSTNLSTNSRLEGDSW